MNWVRDEILAWGALYALQHSGILLRDSVAMYGLDSYSTAYTLAVFAQEEAGKSILIAEQYQANLSGKKINVAELRSLLMKSVGSESAHERKLKRVHAGSWIEEGSTHYMLAQAMQKASKEPLETYHKRMKSL